MDSVLLIAGLRSYGDKFVCGSWNIQTNRPEAVSLHRSSKQGREKKKRGTRWRGGEDGTRWSIYKVKSGPGPSVKQLGVIAYRRGQQGTAKINTKRSVSCHVSLWAHSAVSTWSRCSQLIKASDGTQLPAAAHSPSLWFNRALLIKRRKNWRQSARGANSNPLKVIPYEQLHHETIPNPRSERAKSILKRNLKWVGKGFKKHTHTQTQSCLKASVLINFHLLWNKLPKTA